MIDEKPFFRLRQTLHDNFIILYLLPLVIVVLTIFSFLTPKLNTFKFCLLSFCNTFFSWFLGKTMISKWNASKWKKWYFVLNYCEKKLFCDQEKTFEIQGWRSRICQMFEITRTIYSNSQRSEQPFGNRMVF